MALNRHHRGEGGWIIGVLTGLLAILMPLLVAWSQDMTSHAEGTGQAKTTTRLHIAVQQGRLSVNLLRADIRAVLSQIGEQAGVRMVFSQNSARKVSTQFIDVELEEGLRRLLQLASLSYIVLYGRGPTGASVVQEVRVHGEKGETVVTAEENEMTSASLATVEPDTEVNDPDSDSTTHPFPRLMEKLQAMAAFSPVKAPETAEPLNEQEAMNILRTIFQSPNSAQALRELREQSDDTANTSR
jgi:hypothetical protein